MSHLQQNKSSVASRTAFDVLSVESGEQSEDEVVSEPEAPPVVCVALSSHHSYIDLKSHDRDREAPSKPSKTALKKAAKAARQEKKQQNRVPPSGGDTYERLSPGPTVPLTETEVKLPAPSDRSSEEPRIELPELLPPKSNAIPPRDEIPPSGLNGYSIKPTVGPPRPTRPAGPPSRPSFPQPTSPTTMDKPFAQLLPSSPPAKPAPQPSESIPSSSIDLKWHSASPSLISAADTEAEKAAKKSHNVFVRTLWTFIMLGGFLSEPQTSFAGRLMRSHTHHFRLPTHGSRLYYHPCISMPDSRIP